MLAVFELHHSTLFSPRILVFTFCLFGRWPTKVQQAAAVSFGSLGLSSYPGPLAAINKRAFNCRRSRQGGGARENT